MEKKKNIFVEYKVFFYVLLGLRMGTRASIDEVIFASTRVYFKYSFTCEVLHYRPRNEKLV